VGESLDRFPSLMNTILKQHVYQMVLHRPIESTALIRHWVEIVCCAFRSSGKSKVCCDWAHREENCD